MIFWVSALALIFSVVGNLLVNIKKRYGFLVWIISNIIWIAVNVMGVPKNPQSGQLPRDILPLSVRTS